MKNIIFKIQGACWRFCRDCLRALEAVFWFLGFNSLEQIARLRKENMELAEANGGLRRICSAMSDCHFGDYFEQDASVDWLVAQYNVFFINAGHEKFEAEEFFFMRRIFTQALITAYHLGSKKGDRATKEVM